MVRGALTVVRRPDGIHIGFVEFDRFHLQQLLPGLDLFTDCRLVHRSGMYNSKQLNDGKAAKPYVMYSSSVD